jgi:hypothetical protein
MIEKNTKNILQHEELSFTTITNEVINNIRHTGALGVYCYLSSKSSGWDICRKHLQKHFECGRKHIGTCFSYLYAIGALETDRIRDQKGRFSHLQTILKRKLSLETLSSIHDTQNPLVVVPSDGLSTSTFSARGKRAPINKRYIQNKEKRKKTMPFPSETTNNDAALAQPLKKSKPSQLTLQDLLADNPHSLSEQSLTDWLTVRNKKRNPVTITAWTRMNKNIALIQEKTGISPSDVLARAIDATWHSVEVKYFLDKDESKRNGRSNAVSYI